MTKLVYDKGNTSTTKLRNENETKWNEMKRNETKYNETKRKIKKRNETKWSITKRNEICQTKHKRSKNNQWRGKNQRNIEWLVRLFIDLSLDAFLLQNSKRSTKVMQWRLVDVFFYSDWFIILFDHEFCPRGKHPKK